jgi:hypothetical protein
MLRIESSRRAPPTDAEWQLRPAWSIRSGVNA